MIRLDWIVSLHQKWWAPGKRCWMNGGGTSDTVPMERGAYSTHRRRRAMEEKPAHDSTYVWCIPFSVSIISASIGGSALSLCQLVNNFYGSSSLHTNWPSLWGKSFTQQSSNVNADFVSSARLSAFRHTHLAACEWMEGEMQRNRKNDFILIVALHTRFPCNPAEWERQTDQPVPANSRNAISRIQQSVSAPLLRSMWNG